MRASNHATLILMAFSTTTLLGAWTAGPARSNDNHSLTNPKSYDYHYPTGAAPATTRSTKQTGPIGKKSWIANSSYK
jgi:hypothetical protein